MTTSKIFVQYQENKGEGRRAALRLIASLAIASIGFGTSIGLAQTSPALPDGPVTMVVPFSPAGETDVIARLVAPELSALLKVPVVVENRPGAGGTIGLRHVQNISPSEADRTLLVGSTSTQIIAPLMNPQNVGFNPIEDMVPVAMLGTYYTVLLTSTTSNVQSVDDLRRMAGQPLFYASPGANSEGHLLQVLLADALGATGWEHVAYEGAGPAMTALISSEVQLGVASPIIAQKFVQDGTLRALAVTAGERSSLFPEIPTLKEAGVDLVATGFFGLVGPKGMSDGTAEAIASAVHAVLNMPSLQQRLEGLGLQSPGPQSRSSFLEFQRAYYKRFEALAPAKSPSSP